MDNTQNQPSGQPHDPQHAPGTSSQDDLAVSPVAQADEQKDIPPVSVTGGSKELMPTSTSSFETSADLVTPVETQPTLHEEVKEAGVEAIPEVPTLTLEDKKAGLQHAPAVMPVQTESTGLVQLPSSLLQAKAQVKESGTTQDGKHWLAVLMEKIVKHMQAAHQTLTRK